jgi:hypothetical protein
MINDEDDYILIENPNYNNGKCNFSEKLEKTYIRLYNFNINHPCGESGPLYFSDTKVIPDNRFKLFIYYPLSSVFEVVIETPSPDGFTLKELIYSIKNLYEFIYTEEERTAEPRIYQLKKLCVNCGNQNLSKYVKDTKVENTKEDCCICCSNYEENVENENNAVKLKCNHIFHSSCIKNWLKKSGTCPICRSNIFECENCDGTGIIYYNFTGIVIPLEERGNLLNRNQTNGIFGIHSYDLEDLFIENLFYDNVKKQLYMDISC